MNRIAFALLLLVFLPSAFALELPFPTEIQEINAFVSLHASGRITGNSGKVTFKVLSFQETDEQRVSSLKQSLEINGRKIQAKTEADSYGNNYAVFEVSERGRFNYTIEAQIIKTVKPKQLEDFDLSEEIGEQKLYNKPTKKIESSAASIRTLALNRFPSNSWLETVADITNWTHNYVTYDSSYFPETYSSIQTLESKRGTCDEFATLSAAMLRAKGIPARVIVGPVFSAQEWNFHGWLEVYSPSSGWVQVDSTYGEAGIVDATHIEMGRFPDFSNAADIFIAPIGVNVELEKGKTVEVEVIGFKPFLDMVSIEAENVEFYANSWQDLNIAVENELSSYLIIPMRIRLPESFVVEEENRVLLLKPLERKEVSWKTIIMSDLQKNQYLEGDYVIISMYPRLERTIRVLPGQAVIEGAKIEVTDLYALVEGNRLRIEILLENKGTAAEQVEIALESESEEIEKTSVGVGGFAKKQVTLFVENYLKKPYFVYVTGPTTNYAVTIMPKEELLSALNGEIGEGISGLQEQISKQLQSEDIFTTENLILVVVIFSIVTIMFLLKELMFK